MARLGAELAARLGGDVAAAIEKAIAAAMGQTTALLVEVEDSGDVWRDLTDLAGRDFVNGAEITTTSDDQISNATVRVQRAIFFDSLAPLAQGPRIEALATLPLLRPGARIRISSQMLPLGAEPGTAWVRLFEGYIERVSAPAEEITLTCRDKASLLQGRWIESERVYGVWAPSRAIAVGTVVLPTRDAPNVSAASRYMICTVAGTTHASTEPTWPAKGAGTTVTDGTVTWQEQATYLGTPAEVLLQSLLDDNLGAGEVTLYCPVSPAWYIRDYNQKKQSLWDALRTITDQIGWDLRYVWNSDTSAFELTFFEVDRSAGGIYELGPDKYREITTCDQDLESVRNVVVVKYYDRATLDAQGNPTPATVTRNDSASEVAYGRRWMEVAEDSTSQIDTSTEANVLAAAILSDLKDPYVTLTTQVEHLSFLNLHDVVTVLRDGLHLGGDPDLAIIGIRHTFGPDLDSGGMTEFTFYGRPITGRSKWHGLIAQPGSAPQNRLKGPRSPYGVSANGTIAGGRVVFTPPTDPRERWESSDLHISTSPGFTPSAANRYATSKTGVFDIGGLDPLDAQYAQVIHRDRQGNTSAPSAEVSFTPKAAHTTAAIRYFVTSDSSYANDTAITFGTKDIDDASAWVTDTFTAPLDGWYRVHVQLSVTGAASGGRMRVYFNVNDGMTTAVAAVSNYFPAVQDNSSGYVIGVALDQIVHLDAGDELQVFPLIYGASGSEQLRAPALGSTPPQGGSSIEIALVYP